MEATVVAASLAEAKLAATITSLRTGLLAFRVRPSSELLIPPTRFGLPGHYCPIQSKKHRDPDGARWLYSYAGGSGVCEGWRSVGKCKRGSRNTQWFNW